MKLLILDKYCGMEGLLSIVSAISESLDNLSRLEFKFFGSSVCLDLFCV